MARINAILKISIMWEKWTQIVPCCTSTAGGSGGDSENNLDWDGFMTHLRAKLFRIQAIIVQNDPLVLDPN